jgi:hypothetical protein
MTHDYSHPEKKNVMQTEHTARYSCQKLFNILRINVNFQLTKNVYRNGCELRYIFQRRLKYEARSLSKP